MYGVMSRVRGQTSSLGSRIEVHVLYRSSITESQTWLQLENRGKQRCGPAVATENMRTDVCEKTSAPDITQTMKDFNSVCSGDTTLTNPKPNEMASPTQEFST
ncbi:hypothetical protein C0Q70_03889 [Pomacea canaliculata]|uniref:Uncharacterized protein n=1 Tax=Pomacea canaliculata TaxID=400727 RepID=A0A2T7PU08_POMCA|nr:hypothetical protein C0Q70_03889 [Pomacea canaliculata]